MPAAPTSLRARIAAAVQAAASVPPRYGPAGATLRPEDAELVQQLRHALLQAACQMKEGEPPLDAEDVMASLGMRPEGYLWQYAQLAYDDFGSVVEEICETNEEDAEELRSLLQPWRERRRAGAFYVVGELDSGTILMDAQDTSLLFEVKGHSFSIATMLRERNRVKLPAKVYVTLLPLTTGAGGEAITYDGLLRGQPLEEDEHEGLRKVWGSVESAIRDGALVRALRPEHFRAERVRAMELTMGALQALPKDTDPERVFYLCGAIRKCRRKDKLPVGAYWYSTQTTTDARALVKEKPAPRPQPKAAVPQ